MAVSAGEDAAGADGGAIDIPASAAYRVSLPEFEGPLDLLLHLCKTHEIDILNIPIAFITQKYLEYLETMKMMSAASGSVEIAAEYLVMAATLAYLKSRELVPTPEPIEATGEDGESEIDPREALIRQLLEYQKYKDAAEQLGGRPVEGRNVFGRGAPIAPIEGKSEDAGLAEHSVWKLIAAFADVVKNAGPKITHDVVVDRVSIADRINQIIDRLESGGGSLRFEDLVVADGSEADVRHQLVVTLLSILELAKLRVIRVLQDTATEAFFIARREGAALDEARRVAVTSDVTSDDSEAEKAAAPEPDAPTTEEHHGGPQEQERAQEQGHDQGE